MISKGCTIFLISLITVGILSVPGRGWTADKPIILKIGTSDAVQNPATKATNRFAELVGQKTNGKVKVEVYPASQLGNILSQIESVMTGSLDMTQQAGVWFGQYIKDWNILSLAFAFKDQEHLKKFLSSDLNKQIKDQFFDQYKVRILTENWLRPPNVIATTRPVKKLEDLKGLKMRVPEIEMYLLNWKQLGASPTVLAWGETYMALRQGAVDGVDTPFDFIKGMKFHEVAPHITMTNHLLTNAVIIMNEEVFKKLPEEAKKALTEAARESGDFYTQLGKDTVEADYKELVKLNAKIYEIDNTPFRERMAPLAKELEGKKYWSVGLYDKLQSMTK